MATVQIVSESNLTTDQYEDGKAAAYWKQVVTNTREEYREFLVGLLRGRGCKTVLDAACGNGATSMMLVEAGFRVVSTDLSAAMLRLAEDARRRRLHDPKYRDWSIGKANWLSLPEDIQSFLPNASFDAVVCLGNSFTHLLDDRDNHSLQSQGLVNFSKCLKETGILVIDHRNYDAILRDGTMTADSIYYQRAASCPLKLEISILDAGGAKVVATDFFFTSTDHQEFVLRDFRLCHYAYKVDLFSRLLRAAFRSTRHKLYADFEEPEVKSDPLFYIHVIQKETCEN